MKQDSRMVLDRGEQTRPTLVQVQLDSTGALLGRQHIVGRACASCLLPHLMPSRRAAAVCWPPDSDAALPGHAHLRASGQS